MIVSFREGFYERLGYVTFPLPMHARFASTALLPLLDQKVPGRVERMLVGDGATAYREYSRALQGQVHGMALFDQDDRDRMGTNPFWMALARVDEARQYLQ